MLLYQSRQTKISELHLCFATQGNYQTKTQLHEVFLFRVFFKVFGRERGRELAIWGTGAQNLWNIRTGFDGGGKLLKYEI